MPQKPACRGWVLIAITSNKIKNFMSRKYTKIGVITITVTNGNHVGSPFNRDLLVVEC